MDASTIRKEQLTKVHHEMKLIGTNKSDFVCKSFMKDETYVEFKNARGINSRSDEFKVYCGPIFRAIEEVVYKDPSFIKKVPVADRPGYIMDRLYRYGSRYFASDYTTFEALFASEIMMCCEMQLYEYMSQRLKGGVQWYKTVRKTMTGENICKFKHCTVSVPATRMSGEMCTSLGNGFSNLMFMSYLCYLRGSTDLAGVVEGDDGLFVANGPIPTSHDFEQLGLDIKIEMHDSLELASFCGIVFDAERLVNITEPLKVISNFGWASRRYIQCNPKLMRALIRCKSYSLIAQYPGCPMLQSLGLYGLRVTNDVTNYSMVKVINRMDTWLRSQTYANWCIPRIKPVCFSTRLIMENKFGVCIEDQLAFENYIDKKETFSPIVFPRLLGIVPVSWLEYWDGYVSARGQPRALNVELERDFLSQLMKLF
jgi:hypothetical protein